MNCVFCNIIKGESPREIISETDNTLTILSNPAQVRGHCLVILKRHIEKISELNEKERMEIFSEISKIQEILLRKFQGSIVKQNFKPFIPDSKYKVSHLHFHIQPRTLEDEEYKKSLRYRRDFFIDLSLGELKEIKEEFFNAQ